MALITFRDSDGALWRVWNVSRETLGPSRADYLGEEYRLGWLVFQRDGSEERRRLAQFPDDWAAMTSQQLERMRDLALVASSPRRGSELSDVSREGPRLQR